MNVLEKKIMFSFAPVPGINDDQSIISSTP